MTRPLEGRRVLLTGGSRGIGRAIARELGRQGAKVTIASRDRATLEATRDALRDEGMPGVFSVVCDVTDERQVACAVEGAAESMDGLDAVVNNAGSNGVSKSFLDHSAAEFRQLVELNLFGTVNVARRALPLLLRNQESSIVNVSSMAGKMGVPMWSAYCSAKHAVLGFTKVLAREYAREGLRCNAVCPGFVETEMMSDDKMQTWAENLGITKRELLRELIYKGTPMGKFVEAESVARITAFLVSSLSSDITGQAINVSAGIGDY